MVDGGMSCVKYILFVFNFIFVIFGGLLIYFGFMVIQESQDFKSLVETPDTMAIGVIIIGFFIFLIAFLGCCGAIIESYCVLLSFGVIVTLILTLELAVAGLAFAFKNDVQGMTDQAIKEAINKYNFSDPDGHYSRLIDDFQRNVKCCGATNASDWIEIKGRVPESCCPPEFNASCSVYGGRGTITSTASPFGFGQPSHPLDSSRDNPRQDYGIGRDRDQQPPISDSSQDSNVFQQGCTSAVVGAFSNSLGPVGGVCLAVALFQLLGIIFAFCLGRAVKREYQVV